MIDTHTHVYLSEFDADRAEAMERARAAGVSRLVLPNVDAETLSPLLALYRQDPAFFSVALGLHPTSVDAAYRDALRIVDAALAKVPDCRAIGEVGLDLYRDRTFRTEQIEAFQTQLEWAERLRLPVIVHVREAFDETIGCLRDRGGVAVPVLFHCYAGTARQAGELGRLCDAWFGIGGVVTYKKSSVREALPALPVDRIVLETDAPYLAPTPFRGKRNEPAYLPFVARAIGERLGLAPEAVEALTDRNARRLFRFDD